MLSPSFLTRAGLGLAVTAIERSLALPGRLAGGAVRAYMHVGQTANELASKGDMVLEAVFDRAEDDPEWATFDEDVADGGHGAGGDADSDGYVRDGAVIRSDDAPGD